MISKILNSIPSNHRATGIVTLFGLTKVPMIFFLGPKVVRLEEDIVEVRIPLRKRSKNHLGSMYFGALAAGADIAAGLVAMDEILKSKKDVSLSFSNFEASFLKRAQADVHFICRDVQMTRDFVHEVINSEKRMSKEMTIEAYCPSLDDEIVASFKLTLSLKNKS